MLQEVELQESSLVASLASGNLTSSTVSVPGAVITARKLGAAEARAGGGLTVPIGGAGADIAVPASLFDHVGLEGAILVASVFDASSVAGMSEAGSSLEVRGAVSVNLLSLSSSRVDVEGLPEPMTISLPANRTAGVRCAFWDEQQQVWSSAGLVMAEGLEGSRLVCRTTHLTLFGAIFEGFVKSFRCAQIDLLNAESISELARGQWHTSSGAAVLYSVVLVLAGTLALGLHLDARRPGRRAWTDEHFLVVAPTEAEGAGEADANEQDQKEEEEAKDEETPRTFKKACISCLACMACTTICSAVRWCRSSSALRDAMDDVVSNWITNFGEVRDFIEGLWEGFTLTEDGVAREGGRSFFLVYRLTSGLLMSTAQRQLSASLWTGQEDVAFVLGDEDASDLLSTAPCDEGGTSSSPRATVDCKVADESGAGPISEKARRREEAWRQVHDGVERRFDDAFARVGRPSSVPSVILRIFLVQNPFGGALVQSAFAGSALRTLFLAMDVLGSLLLVTVFFQDSARGKRSRGDCGDTADAGPWSQFGRLLAIGLGSVFFAGIPTSIVSSLHQRSVKRMPSEDCDAWGRQLRAWRLQDRVIWAIGSAYVLFCLFFVCLFLANVTDESARQWALGGFIAVVEDLLIIPLAIAICLPVFTSWLLGVASWMKKESRAAFISRRLHEVKASSGASANSANPPSSSGTRANSANSPLEDEFSIISI